MGNKPLPFNCTFRRLKACCPKYAIDFVVILYVFIFAAPLSKYSIYFFSSFSKKMPFLTAQYSHVLVTCSHCSRSLSDRFPALRKSDRHGFTVVFTAWRHADNSGACLDSGRDLATIMLILYLHTYTVTFPPQHPHPSSSCPTDKEENKFFFLLHI